MGRFKSGAPVPLSQVFAFFDADSDGVWTPSDLAAFFSDYLDALGAAADAELVHAAAAYLQAADGSVTFGSFTSNFGQLQQPRTALLIIDVQNDFSAPNGSLLVPGGADIIPGINALRQRARFDVVVHSRDFHPADHCSFADNNAGAQLFAEVQLRSGVSQTMWPRHCVQHTWGSEFHPALHVAPGDVVVRKGERSDVDSYSAFYDNGRVHQTELAAL